jgi:copper chaperone CopZ
MTVTKTFYPSRIGCPSIPGTVMGIISSLPGVREVKVRYEERAVEVAFDDEKISADAISKKIGEEMGLAFETRDAPPLGAGSAAETCPM